MTHVLHVLPHRGGGAETYIDALERSLGPDFTHERVALSGGREPADLVRSFPRRLPGLRSEARQADIVHAHGDVAAFVARPLSPDVVTTHGLHFLRRANAVAGRVVRTGLERPQLICTSQAERDELGRGTVVLNAAPPMTAGKPIPRADLGVADDAVLALFAGRLEERKRALMAVQAARDAGSPLVLLVVGEGPERGVLERAAHDRVRLLGQRSDLPRLLATADIFVAPADREGLSYALLEAMAHGLAVVASDAPGNAEAIGEAGIVFPRGRRDPLSVALRDLALDPERRAALGAAARARAEGEFTEERFAAETAAVYERALEAKAR